MNNDGTKGAPLGFEKWLTRKDKGNQRNSDVTTQPTGYQQTASRLHSFNRYEIKYLLDEFKVPALREELDAHMGSDPFSPHGGYPVTSLYYDTADLRFYWEKIEGLHFRRKLRMRLYGAPSECTETTPVQVEIKQRVNRVTQKRRIELPYGVARRWLDDRESLPSDIAHGPFVNEVTTLIGNLDLRPIVTTGYLREAFVGRDADLGLRVTIDHKVHGRDRDFHFASGAQNRHIIPPKLAIVEIKANERVPYWVTDLAARIDMSVIRVSKYCQSVQAFGLAPRSMMGAPELITPDPSTPVDAFGEFQPATN
ncbi:polyphosphate polymerase domain-containing protein [Mycobacterium hackensackense]|jgi:hypothetical protein|uniref:polyphosphate polymerase domain-containing protein n=1 Tax=Mycobacterium hackensackense TaxID=228909 RepID=UPI002265A4A2|nr:polyphosphate polymerase domain-containing protein [Mycobacterium hackensackense]MCV7254341.1 polyphosphate polymerase domain-containing protein [Mycobacterium hackensackense]